MMIDATCNSNFRSELDNSVIAKYLYEIYNRSIHTKLVYLMVF
jgi:hypothetical protein